MVVLWLRKVRCRVVFMEKSGKVKGGCFSLRKVRSRDVILKEEMVRSAVITLG